MVSGEDAAAAPRADACPEFAADRAAWIAAAIDEWFVAHFYNSPVSRITDAFNHALAAKEELKRRLIKEV